LHRKSGHPSIHITIWICLGIVLPLLPIMVGIIVAILQRVEVSLTDLLDGIELLLISLGLVTATVVDLSKAELDRSSRPLLFFFIRLLLFTLGLLNIVLLTLIYVNDRVASLKFDSDIKFAIVFILAIAISLITIVMQLYIGYTRYRKVIGETTS